MSSRNTIIYWKEVDLFYERKKGGGGANCLLTFFTSTVIHYPEQACNHSAVHSGCEAGY